MPEPITSLSEGNDGALWLGSEIGSIFRFDTKSGNHQQFYISYGRVYKVVPLSEDLLLVGLRNAGLKLVRTESDASVKILKHYTIDVKHKGGANYSPYDFTVFGDTIYVATSNGLLETPLHANGDSIVLSPLYPAAPNQNIKFFSVIERRGEIFAAGNRGMIKYTPSSATTTLIDTLRKYNHLFKKGEAVKALTTDGELLVYEVSDLKSKNKFGNAPLVYFEDNSLSWALSSGTAEVADSRKHKTYTFPTPLAIGGDNSRGRQAIAAHGDFYYIATSRSLLKIPRSFHANESPSITTACFSPHTNRLYAVTSRNDLFEINCESRKALFIRNIELEDNAQIKKLLGNVGKELFFATSSGIYGIDPNFYSVPRRVDSDIRASKAEIYNSLLDRHDKLLFVSYADSIFSYDIVRNSSRNINPCDDFYIQAITHSSGNSDELYAGSLNHGVYKSVGDHSVLEPLSSDIKPVLDIAPINTNNMVVLVPSMLYKMKKNDDGVFHPEDGMPVPATITRVIYAGAKIFGISLTGGFTEYNAETLRQQGGPHFSDIVFEKQGAFAKGDSLVLSSSLGLAIVRPDKDKSLNWIKIPEPGYFGKLYRWRFPVGILLIILAIAVVVAVAYGLGKAIVNGLKLLKIVNQRKDEINRFRGDYTRIHDEIDPKSAVEIIDLLDDWRLDKRVFLLSDGYWELKQKAIGKIAEAQAKVELHYREIYENQRKRLIEISSAEQTEIKCLAEFIQEGNTIFGRISPLEQKRSFNDKVVRWLALYDKVSKIKAAVASEKLISDLLRKELSEEINAIVQQAETLCDASYEQWISETSRLEAHFRPVAGRIKDYRKRSVEEVESEIKNKIKDRHVRAIFEEALIAVKGIKIDVDAIYELKIQHFKMLIEIATLLNDLAASDANLIKNVYKKTRTNSVEEVNIERIKKELVNRCAHLRLNLSDADEELAGKLDFSGFCKGGLLAVLSLGYAKKPWHIAYLLLDDNSYMVENTIRQTVGRKKEEVRDALKTLKNCKETLISRLIEHSIRD